MLLIRRNLLHSTEEGLQSLFLNVDESIKTTEQDDTLLLVRLDLPKGPPEAWRGVSFAKEMSNNPEIIAIL